MWAIVRRKPLLFILLCALILRGSAAVVVQHYLDHRLKRPFLIEGDSNGYWTLAERMARGESYELYDPPRKVLRMPGFPAVLSLAICAADSLGLDQYRFLLARLLLAGVGTLACWLVYLLGKDLFDRRVGIVAAAVTAVTPVMIGFSVIILSETLFGLALVFSLLAAARLCREEARDDARPSRLYCWAVTAGIGVALATYVRPSWLPAAAGLAVLHWIVARHKARAVASGLVLCAAAGIAMLPWMIRNHRVTGHWVVTTLWMGPSLYDGLHPQANGDSNMQFYDDERLMEKGMSEYDVNREYAQRAVAFAKENPGRALQLGLAKWERFFKPWPNAPQFDSLTARLAIAVFYIPLIVFAVCGAWHHRRNVAACALALGPLVFFALLHFVFVGSLRYRLPAEYPLTVLCAAGLLNCFPASLQTGSIGQAPRA